MSWDTNFNFYIKLNSEIKDKEGEFPNNWNFCEKHGFSEDTFSVYSADEGPGEGFWIANIYAEGIREVEESIFNCTKPGSEEGGGFAVSFLTSDWQKIIDLYLNDPMYSKVFDKIKEVYGENSFTVHYGVIKTWC